MKVLLFGNGQDYHVGAYFRRALDELGLNYVFIDESRYLKHLYDSSLHKIFFHFLKRPINYEIYNNDLLEHAIRFQADIILIIKGAFINLKTIIRIKEATNSIFVNFATDDPKNGISSTSDIVAAIPYYDLYACTKRAIIPDVKKMGCPEVKFVPFGFDPVFHYPEHPVSVTNFNNFYCDVCFIGGADRDRIPTISKISQVGDINFHLYGGYWNRISKFRKYYKGFAIGRDFRLAIGCAKINVGLVRRANRDGHAMRSFEIPACGGFMLAERTEEHLEFFTEGSEAEFFDSNEEMVDKICYYMEHDSKRRRIAESGHLKVVSGNHTYRDRLLEILRSTQLL